VARALRNVAIVVAVIVLVGAALVGGVRLWLETGHGGRFAARQVTERVSGAIAGDLSAERVGLDGLSGVTAEGVELRSPEGDRIGSAARLSADLSVRELLGGGPIVVRGLRVEGLVLDVVAPEDEAPDLVRALRSAVESEVDESGPGRPISILDARIGIERLTVRAAPGAPPDVAAGPGELAGDLRIEGERLEVDGRARLDLARPIAGPLELSARVRLEGGSLELPDLVATLPGAVEVAGSTRPREAPRPAGGDPEGTSVPPLELSISLPADGLLPYGGPPLRGAVAAQGSVSFDAGRIEVRATVRPPGPGEIEVLASLGPGDPRRLDLLVDARGVDPSRLDGAAPAGRVWAALRLRGAAALPPDARAAGTFWLARSRVAGERIGPGRARVAVRGARVSADGIDLSVPGGRVRGRLAAGGKAPLDADLRGSFSRVESLVAAARSLGADVPDAAGALDGRLRVGGAAASRRLVIDLAAPSLTISGRSLSEVDAAVRLDGAALTARVSARTPDGPLAADLRGTRIAPERLRIASLALTVLESEWRLDGPTTIDWGAGRLAVSGLVLRGPGVLRADGVLSPGEGARGRRVRADLAAEAVPLEILELLRPEGLPDGVADARARIRGTLRAPEVDLAVRLQVREGDERAVAELSVQGTTAKAEGRLLLDVNGAPAARAEATLRAAPQGDLVSAAGVLSARLEATLSVPTLDTGILARLGVPLGGVRGTLEAAFTASGPLGKADVAGDVRIADVVVLDHPDLGRLPPLAADLRIDAGSRAVELSFLAEAPGVPAIRGAFRLGRPLPELLAGGRIADAAIEGRLEVERGPLALMRLGARADAVGVRAELAGTLGDPAVEVTAEVEDLVVDEMPLGAAKVEASATTRGGRLALRMAPRGGGTLVAEAEALPGEPWRAVVEARQASLDALRFLPQTGVVEGAFADGRLELRGGSSPRAEGELRLEARRLPLAGYGTFRDVVVELRASESRLEIRRLTAALLGGRADASGEIAWWDGGARAALRLDADAFPVPRELRPLGELTARADVALALDGRRVEGTIALSPGEIRLAEGGPGELHPTSLPPTYVVHEGEGEEAAAEERGPSYSGRVHLTIPRDFWVRSEAANLEVTADLTALLEGDRLSFTGAVRVPRGSLSVLARRFEVERLALSFAGDPEIDPGLDGRLTHEQPALRVWIDLTGRLREPELALSSDPPMDPDQIALAVAAGRTVEPGAGLSGAVLAGALNVVAGEVGQALTENLPIDVLEVELGPGGEARRIEAGTYVGPRLFLSFARNVFALPDENENEVRAEYQLGRSVSLSSRYGDRQSGALNLLWERRFRSGAQRDGGVAPARAAEVGSGAGSLGGGAR
jgi:autotransporter translocation and assembly factor TamB